MASKKQKPSTASVAERWQVLAVQEEREEDAVAEVRRLNHSIKLIDAYRKVRQYRKEHK